MQAGLISFSLTGLDGAHRRCGCTALHVPHWLPRAPPGAPSVAQCAGPSRGGRARAPRSARCSGRGAPARGSVCLRTRPRLLRALAGRRSLASRRPSSTARAAAASAGFLGCIAQPLRPLRRGLGREARLRLAPSRAGGRISAITRAHRPAHVRTPVRAFLGARLRSRCVCSLVSLSACARRFFVAGTRAGGAGECWSPAQRLPPRCIGAEVCARRVRGVAPPPFSAFAAVTGRLGASRVVAAAHRPASECVIDVFRNHC